MSDVSPGPVGRSPGARRRSGRGGMEDGDEGGTHRRGRGCAATRAGPVGASRRAGRGGGGGVLSGLPDAQVVAVREVVPAAAGKLAAEYGGRAVPDVEALLGEGP